MDFAKARQSYETVFSLLRELKDEQSVPQLFRAARHVFSLNTFVSRQGGTDSGSIWKERIDDLHGQLASAVVKFLQQFSQISEQYGNACLSLLYVGAEACERFEQEKEALLTQLTLERGKNAELNKSLESQFKDSALKENLELRTRLVVQQQNTIQREAETRELVQRLQKTLAEKNALHIEKERLAVERTRNFQILERQATAISQLMDESENNAKQKDQALGSLKMINEDNRILTMNLERHSKVIEDLINVNAEMIDAANCYARMQDWDESHPKEAHPSPIYTVDDDHDGKTNFYRAEPVTVDEDCKISYCAVEKAQTRSDVLEEKVLVTDQVSEQTKQVIEDLINVNAEMIDAANRYARMQDWDESHPKEAHPLPIYSVDDNHDGKTNFYRAEPVTVDEDCKISSCAVEKAQTRSDVLEEKVLVTDQVSEQTEQTKAKRNSSSCPQHLSFC